MYLKNFFVSCFAVTFIVSIFVLVTLGNAIPPTKKEPQLSIDAGRAASADCASCHGVEGRSTNPSWPNLAGQNADYVIKQLKSFREGTRDSEIMESAAEHLSDQQIRNLAAYYASLK